MIHKRLTFHSIYKLYIYKYIYIKIGQLIIFVVHGEQYKLKTKVFVLPTEYPNVNGWIPPYDLYLYVHDVYY